MKKLFWVAVGIGIGVLAAQQLNKARTLTPGRAADSILDRITSTVDNASRAFKEGMSAREDELRAALGVDDAPRGRHASQPEA